LEVTQPPLKNCESNGFFGHSYLLLGMWNYWTIKLKSEQIKKWSNKFPFNIIGVFSSHWFSHLPFLTIVQSNFSIPASHGYHMYSFKQFFWKHIKWLYDFILECLHHHIFSNILFNATSHINQTCIISRWSLIAQLLVLMFLLLLTIFFYHFTNLIWTYVSFSNLIPLCIHPPQ
jgi:hypothetical protein